MYLYTFIAMLQIQKYPQHFFLLFFYRRISKERGEKLITSSKISLNNYSNPRVEQFETTRSSNNFREFSLLYNPLCRRGGEGGIENTGLSVLCSLIRSVWKKKKAGRDVRAFKILSTLKSSKTWEMHRAFRTTVTSFSLSRASSLKSDCQSRIRFILLAEISMLPNFFIIYRFGIKKEGREISISQKRGHDKLSILLRKKCFFHPLYMGRGNDEKIIGNPWKIVGKILWFF